MAAKVILKLICQCFLFHNSEFFHVYFCLDIIHGIGLMVVSCKCPHLSVPPLICTTEEAPRGIPSSLTAGRFGARSG